VKLKLIAAGAAAAALTSVGAANAGHAARHHHHPPHVAGGLLAAASTYLGVDRATLLASLEAGQSLAQIATAKGKTADGLVTALLAPSKLKLDAAVAAGRLTAAQETTMLSRLQTALTALVNKTKSPKTAKHIRLGPDAVLRPALAYLGIDFKTLATQLRAGKTLAAVAAATAGKSAAGLVDAIVASVKTKLDAKVAAGRITAAQETDFLTTFKTNVAKLVNG
jgi:hypothetical protein